MKHFVRVFVLLMVLALLLCGCETAKDKTVTETYPTQQSNSEVLFSGENKEFRQVLSAYSTMGYVLLDLDGNGSDELLITDGNLIYGLYAICEDGTVDKKLELAGYVEEIFLCEDNRIYVHSSDDGGACHYYYVYSMRDKAGNLPVELCVMYWDGNWYAGDNEKDAQPVTESEGKALLDELSFQTIAYTPFYE